MKYFHGTCMRSASKALKKKILGKPRTLCFPRARLRAEFNIGASWLRTDWDFSADCAMKRSQRIFQRLLGAESRADSAINN